MFIKRPLKYAFLATLVLIPAILFAQTPGKGGEGLQLLEQKIKAGLLYNFTKLTRWPESADRDEKTIDFCTYGENAFAEFLRPIEGQVLKQREIVVRLAQSVEDSAGCHIVFIGTEGQREWSKLRQFIQGKHILTVGDFPGFAEAGGMIEFQKVDNRVGVFFNLEAFHQAGLDIDSSVLHLSGVQRVR